MITNLLIMIIKESVKTIKDHGDFWAIGYDTNKVNEGIEDLTRLRDIDDSKPWSKDIYACKIIDPVEGYTAEELAGQFNLNLLE